MNAKSITRLRLGGWVAVAAGVIGVASAVFLLLVTPTVSPDQFSFPLEPNGFAIIQVAFFFHHLLMSFSLWALWRSDVVADSRLSTTSALLATGSLGALGVWELVVIGAAGLPYPSPETEWIDIGYGAIVIAVGVGLVLFGVAVARARVLTGASRWIVLVTGIFVFVPMTPGMLLGFTAGRVVIGLWLVLFGLVGVVMLTTAANAARSQKLAGALESGTE